MIVEGRPCRHRFSYLPNATRPRVLGLVTALCLVCMPAGGWNNGQPLRYPNLLRESDFYWVGHHGGRATRTRGHLLSRWPCLCTTVSPLFSKARSATAAEDGDAVSLLHQCITGNGSSCL